MGSIAGQSPLIVILGPTASGKSALALDLARRFNGEIIAADSRTIYKGMDIGTAKPSIADRRAVRHHLIDVITPDQPFSVADFQRLANEAIADIASRQKVPFLVGGSGLYIDAVIYNFSFRRPSDPAERQRLAPLSVEDLQVELENRGLPRPENYQNPRHLIRSLEASGEPATASALRPNTLVVGLDVDREILEQKIRLRVDDMIERDFVDEVRRLAAAYGWEASALQAPGYKAFRLYLAGQISLEQARQQFVQNDFQYAKRQKTWFRRNKDIHWISKSEDAVDLVTTFLNK